MTGGYLDKDEEEMGIYWNSNRTYKATISNSLYMDLAISLFELTNENKYLEAALATYKWIFEEKGLVSEDNDVYDGYRPGDNTIDPKVWTYNPGALVAALVKLARIK